MRKDPEKYQGVIERTVEDFSRSFYDIKSFITKDSSTFDGVTHENIFGASKITYIESIVHNFIENGDISILNAVYHENTHVDQGKSLPDNYMRYMMYKEILLRNKIPEYYETNYREIFYEIEAREKGAEGLLELLESFGMAKAGLEFTYNGKKTTDIVGELQSEISSERELYGHAFIKNINGKQVNINDYFDHFIADNPHYISNSVLTMEYNEDGRLKTLEQILSEILVIKDDKKVDFYYDILRNGNILKKQFPDRNVDELIEEITRKIESKSQSDQTNDDIPASIVSEISPVKPIEFPFRYLSKKSDDGRFNESQYAQVYSNVIQSDKDRAISTFERIINEERGIELDNKEIDSGGGRDDER